MVKRLSGLVVVLSAVFVLSGFAALAQSDLTVAYNDAAGRPATHDLTGQDLGGLTLSTALSLLVVPAFYLVTDRMKARLRRTKPAAP